jgi:hypothetical protein
MDTQLTTVMVPLTAGLVACLKQISIWGCVEKGHGLVIWSALVMYAKLLSFMLLRTLLKLWAISNGS